MGTKSSAPAWVCAVLPCFTRSFKSNDVCEHLRGENTRVLTHDDLAAIDDLNVFVCGSFVRVHFHQGLLGEGERHIVKVSIPSVNVKVPFLQELEAVNLLHKFLVALHINWRGEGPDKKQQQHTSCNEGEWWWWWWW